MEVVRPAAAGRLRDAIGIAVALALTVPAGASAGPVEDVAGAAAQSAGPPVRQTVERVDAVAPVSQALDRTRATAAPLREPVGRTVAQIEPTVQAVADGPVGSALDAAKAPLDEARGLPPAVVGAPGEDDAPTAAPADRGRRGVGALDRRIGDGAIDRRAARRAGRPAGGPATDASAALTRPAPFRFGTVLVPAVETPRASASSMAASGDGGGLDLGLPPFGHDGGAGLLGGPAGIGLVALGLLALMLTVVPRFYRSLLHMAPVRWGLAAFRLPIERPG